jgi:hypothetical protein
MTTMLLIIVKSISPILMPPPPAKASALSHGPPLLPSLHPGGNLPPYPQDQTIEDAEQRGEDRSDISIGYAGAGKT